VDSRSFSEAARRLNMPVSTVSRRVAELEQELGVQLLERSTRNLRLTDIGHEIYKHARHGLELSDAVHDIVSDHHALVCGTLRVSAPPSLSDSLLVPLIAALQNAHPQVSVQALITERVVDLMAEGVDVAFFVGLPQNPELVTRVVLTYRHRVLASPDYLRAHPAPHTPEDLLQHRLLAFSFWRPENTWNFVRADGSEMRSISFRPYLATNDYAGIVPRLLDGAGIGELPPLVRPDLVRDGKLIEVMDDWHFPNFDLKIVHPGGRYVPRIVRIFVELAAQLAPALFPFLPAGEPSNKLAHIVQDGARLRW